MDTREAAERWRDVWARGWRDHDADSILALYAPDATQQSHPFRAVVEWSAETNLKDGGTEKLAGVSLLRFDTDGLVVEQRDFWAAG
jgi:hypothetical protein